ncbi:MAG: hypothetical protein RLZZ436_1619 [Planctomycetota bacterium]
MTLPVCCGSRREMLRSVSAGFGSLALAGLMAGSLPAGAAADQPLAPKPTHFPPRARRVIFLCMQGGPSHVDTFDYKPKLIEDAGRSIRPGNARLMAPRWEFKQRGQSGLWISDLFPEVAAHADKLCLLRSMHCDQPVHPQAMTQMHTGSAQFVRPSLGAWTLYGLGTENDSLPGFVALNPPAAAAQNFGSAFLPAIYQGSRVGAAQRGPAMARPAAAQGQSVPDIRNPRLSQDLQRRQIDFIQTLNRQKLKREQSQPGVEGVIESFELAFRMQDALPSLMDLSGETDSTLELYGINGGRTAAFGRQCLLARRFVEAGVRFVELNHGNWDHHFRLEADLAARSEEVDRPIAGLLADLDQRGLLKDTLVMWGGEFGRTPDAQGGDGRDHNNRGYTMWMAGGGVRGGFSYGATDDYGGVAVENKCHIHDWHATILHLLGLDHTRLTYRYAGRDFRLTDVYGNVVQEIIS